MICEQYPPEDWTNVYTDDSTTNAIHVLPFTSLAAAQKQPVQQQEDTKQLQSRGIDDGNHFYCGLTTEEHHGCISHWCALSSTNSDQQHIATSSKSSAITQQQMQSGPSVDTRPLWSSWTLICRQVRKERCTNRATRC